MKIFFLIMIQFLQVNNVLMQSDYKIIFEHVEAISYNKSYMNRLETHNFKYNRTHAAVNITFDFKRDFDLEFQVEIQYYKMASNEYRYFPIRFGFNFCQYAATNELGLGELFECGNFSCPIKKGLRIACYWKPNSQKYPPHIHTGSYMNDVKFFYRSVEVFFMQSYGTVKYPEIKGMHFF